MTTQDERFKSIHNDPRFIRPKKKKEKLNEQDDRFKNLKQKSSSLKSQIPKLIDYARGRVVLESSEEEDENDDEDDDSDSDSESVVQLGPGASSSKIQEKIPPEIDLNEDEVEQTPNNTNQIEPTKRIGIVNLDWDHVKPIDIYKVFSSLLSPNHHQPEDTRSGNLPIPPKLKGDPSVNTNTIIKGQVVQVRIYKSQFGKERMKIEDIQGPPQEIFKRPSENLSGQQSVKDDTDEDDDECINNDEQGFDEEALRKYQLDRLRYFYAIVELDSVRTAHHVFTQIDGTEFERTANIFDLSYVPDEMTFDEEDLWDECAEDCNDYKGVDFSTDVLRHSKVKLTWDSEDPIRSKYTRLNTQKLKQEELDSMDFKNFLAPPSSEEETEDLKDEEHNTDHSIHTHNSTRSKNLRQLLGLVKDQRQTSDEDDQHFGSNQLAEGELNITFKPGFIDLNLDQANSDIKSNQNKSKNQKIKQKLKSKDTFDDQSIFLDQRDEVDSEKEESFLIKKKDKKKDNKNDTSNGQIENEQQKKELELLMMEDGGSTQNYESHFDLNQIIKSEKNQKNHKKKKNKFKNKKSINQEDNDDEEFIDNFSIDPTDQRFGNFLVNHPEFAIDPSNPQFKKTKNMMDLLISTGEKRRAKDQDDPSNQQIHVHDKPTLDHTRLLMNQIKKSSSSFKRPKLI